MRSYKILIAVGIFALLAPAAAPGQPILVLAPDNFLNELQPLKHFKDATCRPVTLLGLSQVYANFAGADRAEDVKLCIAHYQQTLNVQHVLLVGDVDCFPVRWRYWGRWLPKDPYYQGSWRLVNGRYEQTDSAATKAFGSWVDIGAQDRYTIEVDVVRGAGSEARILFADADRAEGQFRLGLMQDGFYVKLCNATYETSCPFVSNQSYRVKIVLAPTNIQVYVDGFMWEYLALGQYQLVGAGKVGLGTYACSASFDNFVVTSTSGTILWTENFNSGAANGFTDALTANERNWAPSELYYADLFKDGTTIFDNWNANNNGLYGEIEWRIATYCPNCTLNNDHIDYLPDISVGRIPASSKSEVTRYVNKVIKYELAHNSTDPRFRQAVLYEGTTGQGAKNDSIATFLVTQGFSVSNRRWGGDLEHLTSAQLKEMVVDNLNSGCGLINYLGHGNFDAWSCLKFDSNDVRTRLTNSGMLPIVFAGACYTGKFAPLPLTTQDAYTDVSNKEHAGLAECEPFPGSSSAPNPVQLIHDPDCIAEDFLFNSGSPLGTGGAIAYLGESREGRSWGGQLSEYFFRSYSEGSTVGAMWKKSIEDYYWANNLAQSYLWDYGPARWEEGHMFDEPQKFVLFGDPSVVVGGAFSAEFGGIQYDWPWPFTGPLYPFSRYRVVGDVMVPLGQRLTAQFYNCFLFDNDGKITGLDSNASNGFIVNASANTVVSFIALGTEPQTQSFMKGVKVSGQMRLRNGGAIRLHAGP